MALEAKFQIGKNGVTDNFIENLQIAFKTHKVARISVLKNFVRDKVKVREIADDLVEKLEGDFVYKIIGFTIVLRKWKKR
jgi:RNA-binding protein